MRRPYSEPPGTPLDPRLAPELTPTPAVIDGTCEPTLRPTSTLVFVELPRSGVGETIVEFWGAVGRLVVVSFSFGGGVDFVVGKT